MQYGHCFSSWCVNSCKYKIQFFMFIFVLYLPSPPVLQMGKIRLSVAILNPPGGIL